MADPDGDVNAGEENTNAPTNLPLSRDDQFRTLSKRVEDLTSQVGKLATPPTVRVVDVVQIIIILLDFVVTAITGYGLETRISDVRSDVSAAEQRLAATIQQTEARLSSRLDKNADQTTKMDERLSRIEGAKGQLSK